MDQNTAPDLILVKTALDKLCDEETIKNAVIGRALATDPVIFTQDQATNAAVVSSVLGGGGYFEKTLDDVSSSRNATIAAAAKKTTLIANFKKNMPIARTFMADQQQSAVAKAVKQQTKTWISSQERNAFNVYALGFTTQLTIDGVALFSASHVNENGDTVNNLETGALSDTNLNTVVDDLRTQKAQTGVILGYEPEFLLVPSILHLTASAITKSVLRAGTGENDENYWSEYYPGMKVQYSPFLNSTSTTAYFVGSSTNGVFRFEREAFFTKLVDWSTDPDDMYMYKMRAREEVDSIEYSGVVGSTGATA